MAFPGFHLAIYGLSLLALSMCGCKTPTWPGEEASLPAHKRALRHFAAAHLVKPSDPAAASALLPPWILLEEPGAAHRVPGTVREATLETANASPATLYFQAGTTAVHGTTYPQVTYLWLTAGTYGWQGVRITLNTAGKAVIWEVLRDSSGRKHIFVADALEQAARQEYGVPLEGRQFAIERSREAAPDVKVVRAIEEGPVPMGPMVYQDRTLDVSTVICRCMPAQADHLTGTSSYELQPADGVLALWEQANGGELWPRVLLENWLRLPRVF